MCFSATASFTTGALLLAVGASTWRMAGTACERPLAAVPLLFGVQQLVEGFIWLGFATEPGALQEFLTQVYGFFSHVLWPAWVPLAAWLVETRPARRRVLGASAVAGFALGAWMLFGLFTEPLVALPTGRHVEYTGPQFYGPALMLSYLAVTTGSLVLSSRALLRVFGAMAVASFAIAYLAYAQWLISVWCFFAAVLSAIVWLHFASRRAPELTVLSAGSP